ncbi:MAG: arsenate reductase ArsC [Woeseiaceae bacterium]
MSADFNILVLCTGNSARSILAEVLLNELGGGQIRAFSAGSHPVGRVNRGAINMLKSAGHAVAGLASKSWDRFSTDDAPRLDLVITVCDNAAGESCPIWNGAPVSVHWGIPDPASDGDFDSAYARLRSRVEALLELPFKTMSAAELGTALSRVHRSGAGATGQE